MPAPGCQSNQTEACGSILGKERLSGIVWKCVQIEASLPNLLKCKLRGNWVLEVKPSGLWWKTSSSACQALRDSVLAHDHIHRRNRAE